MHKKKEEKKQSELNLKYTARKLPYHYKSQTYMECSFLKTVDVKRSSHICVFEQCTFGEEIVSVRRQSGKLRSVS